MIRVFTVTAFLSIFSLLAAAQTARVQVIHNSADAAAATVDVYANGAALIPDFAFRTATPFIDVPAGVDIDLAIAPGNSMSASEAVYNQTVNLTADETYVVIATGIVSATGYSPNQPFTLAVYPMGREAASMMANTDVLVFHGATDAPTVDVTLPDGTALVNDVSYGAFATDGYLQLPTDDYMIEVRDASGVNTVAAYDAPLQTLGLQGNALVVLASGFLDPMMNSNGAAFGLFAALPAGGNLVALPVSTPPTARVQVIHNCADAAAAVVDVYANGALLIPDFAFRSATPFVDVPAGVDIELAVAPGNSSSAADAIYTQTVNLADAGKYIVIASGIVSPTGYSPTQPFTLAVYPMGREAASVNGNTDVLVFHGATDAPVVDVTLTSGTTLVDDIAYANFASNGYLELPTADYQIQVRDASGANVVASYAASLAALGLENNALVVLASGFLDPTMNSNGASFGLYAALAAGGSLVALPTFTGIEDEIKKNTLIVFPNPATNSIRVSHNGLSNGLVELTDAVGRVVLQQNITVDETLLDVTALSNGVYGVRVVAQNAAVSTGRIMVSNR